MAVCPEQDVRNGAKAVQLAERPRTATGYRNPRTITTLAAAYAEVGRFPEAIDAATKTLDLLGPGDSEESSVC